MTDNFRGLIASWRERANCLRAGRHEDPQYRSYAVKLDSCAEETQPLIDALDVIAEAIPTDKSRYMDNFTWAELVNLLLKTRCALDKLRGV